MPARGTQRAALALVVALLLLAPGALAATPAQEGYNAPGGRAQSDVQSQGAASAASAASPSTSTRPSSGDLLPFSGMDLAFAVVVGGGLVLLGGGLRRLSGREPGHDD
jgi:hypothetical protein